MSLRISLKSGEKLIFKDGLEAAHYPYPFTFAVTDRAIFVTKEKHFAAESWYLERIPLEQIRRIILKREKISSVLAVSGLIFFFALLLLIFTFIPFFNGEPEAEIRFMPFTLLILGISMPFLAARRKILIIETTGQTYKWKPKIVTGWKLDDWRLGFINKAENRDRIRQMQENFLKACRKAGIKILTDDKN
jgi:hypothetical protein